MGLGFVSGLGFRVQGFGFRVVGCGLWVVGLEFVVQALGLSTLRSELRVQGLEIMV